MEPEETLLFFFFFHAKTSYPQFDEHEHSPQLHNFPNIHFNIILKFMPLFCN
jgi:hypothetical protein